MKNRYKITLIGYFSLQDRLMRLLKSIYMHILDFLFFDIRVKYINYTYKDDGINELKIFDCVYSESFPSCVGVRVIISDNSDSFSLSVYQFLTLILFQNNIKFINDIRDSHLQILKEMDIN